VLLGLPLLRSLSLDGDISEDSLASVGRCTKLTRLELQVGPQLQCMIMLRAFSSLLQGFFCSFKWRLHETTVLCKWLLC